MKLFSNSTDAKPITWGRWIRLNAILLGLVCLVSLSFPVSTLSQKLNDFFFRLRRPLPVSSQVALVLIDDATLEQHGRWPWPRAELAKLIRAVSAQNPKAIGVDVLLPELEDEQNDSALASAIQSAPNIVLAAKISTSPTGKPAPQLAGKTVLIGFGGIDISDRLITPVSNQLPMPGVEINANVADMALSGRILSQIGNFGQLTLLVLMSLVSLWVVVRYPG